MKDMMKALTSIEEFETFYQEDRITIFTFSADWCPDCLYIKPFMPSLIEKYHDYRFIYINQDQFADLAKAWFIMGIPSFVAIRNGNEMGRFVSKMRKSKNEIDRFLANLVAK